MKSFPRFSLLNEETTPALEEKRFHNFNQKGESQRLSALAQSRQAIYPRFLILRNASKRACSKEKRSSKENLFHILIKLIQALLVTPKRLQRKRTVTFCFIEL